MSNRASRRAARKHAPKWENMSRDQLMNRLAKNGITLEDLTRNYELGRQAGIEGTYKTCFAAACLALNELHGFGCKRCHKFLSKMQQHIIDSLCSAEAVDEVFARVGLTLDFGDPGEWARMEDGSSGKES